MSNVVPMRDDAQPMTPMGMLDKAVASGASVEVLAKLMDLQERWEKNQARKAFEAAISAAKAALPVISKDGKGHNDKRYATFAEIARTVDPVITGFGLSYRFRTTQDERIHVTCILSHEAGHSEETTLAGPADTSGSKNAIQAIGSTLTYLQRYSLTQALGLAAAEDDDGRDAGASERIGPDQVEVLQRKIVESGSDLPRFLKVYRIERLEDMRLVSYGDAIKKLDGKLAGQQAQS